MENNNQTLSAFAGSLAGTLDRLCGVKPAIHWVGRTDAGEMASWWEVVTGNSGATVYVGAEESSWRSLAARVIGVDPLQAYATLLEQSAQQARARSGEVPPGNSFDCVELQFPDRQTVRLMLGSREAPQSASALGALSMVEVPITIRLGSTRMLLRDLADLDVGSAVEVDQRLDDTVDILVNGQLIAKGDLVVLHDNYGIKITEVSSRGEALEHLVQA